MEEDYLLSIEDVRAFDRTKFVLESVSADIIEILNINGYFTDGIDPEYYSFDIIGDNLVVTYIENGCTDDIAITNDISVPIEYIETQEKLNEYLTSLINNKD